MIVLTEGKLGEGMSWKNIPRIDWTHLRKQSFFLTPSQSQRVLNAVLALLSLFALSGCFFFEKPKPEIKAVFVGKCDWTTTLLPLLSQGWIFLSAHQPSSEEKDAPVYVLLQKP